jgi:hypothetical protein
VEEAFLLGRVAFLLAPGEDHAEVLGCHKEEVLLGVEVLDLEVPHNAQEVLEVDLAETGALVAEVEEALVVDRCQMEEEASCFHWDPCYHWLETRPQGGQRLQQGVLLAKEAHWQRVCAVGSSVHLGC